MGNKKMVYRFFFFLLSLSNEKETHFTYCQEQITKPVTGKEEKENFPLTSILKGETRFVVIQLASFLVVCVQLYANLSLGQFSLLHPGQVWLN